jgi:hypothetical protein
MWQRPGKAGREGSATFNFGGSGLFYVFSTNAAPFESGTSYRPFAVYAILEHGGDFTEAARELGRKYAPAPVVKLGPERANGHPHPAEAPPAPPPGAGPADDHDGGPRPPRVPIDVTEIDLPDVTRQAWTALGRANGDAPRLFRQGSILCRIEHDDRGRPLLRELDSTRMCHELARAAAFYRVSGGKAAAQRALPPPTPVVLDVLATPAPPLPAVERLTECPAFAPDGTLEQGTGYHPRSRTYCTAAVPGLAPVPAAPTAADVARALALFTDDLLADFPFVEEADRANALALALLPYARDLIPGPTPLYGVEAPTPGSGKGLLVDALLLPSCGHSYSNLTQRGDDAEWRKAITAALRDGQAAILIDNVTQHLTSGALASALTKTVWDDRILGTNGTVRLPVRCLWVATANNPTFSTELARRTVPIRLDPKVDRPWERGRFRHKHLLAWVREHRAELVWAGLVLVQHWLAQGRPAYAERTLGSFEEWAGVMGGILKAAGVEGFLANVGRFYEAADVETTVWRRFVERWWEQHQGSVVGAGDLFELAQADEAMDLGTGNERSQRTRFGKALGKQRDRVIGGFRVVQDGELRRVLQWRLLDTRPAGAER